MNKQELKAAEKKAIEGLAGAAKKAAKKAFYEAHKEIIQAIGNAEALADYASVRAEENELKAEAAKKGLKISITANTGYVRGSSWDSVILVTGGAFPVKDILKANGARWLASEKAWVFANADEFKAALAAI